MVALSKFELVTAVLLIGLFCATGPLLAEPASAKEKPLLPTFGFGVRSYTSFSQLMKPPRTLHLPSDYSPAVSLPYFSYNTGSERASAGDFWPRGDRYTSVIRPGASNLFQPVSAMKFPSRNFDVIHNFHLSKYPAAAQRFDLYSNIRKREPASSSSH